MAKSFDELVKRTSTKKTRARAARRAQELIGASNVAEARTPNARAGSVAAAGRRRAHRRG
jgi:hypothetical protein